MNNTLAQYTENLQFNLEAAKSRRKESVSYITVTEKELAQTDGRRKAVIAILQKRIEQAKADVARLEEKIHDFDTLETHLDELAEIDEHVTALCARRRELTKNDSLHHYVKGKAYGLI